MSQFSFETLGLVLFTTVFLSMLLVPLATRLAHRVGAIDIPKSRSSHATPTPRMGGLAISLSLLIACLLYLPWNDFSIAFLSGLIVIVLTGSIDDVREISPRWKFLGQIVAAVLFTYLSGNRIDQLGDILGLGNALELGGFSFLFTVFCLVGGMNALNLSDGLDGLAGGLSVIAGVFFAYFAWSTQNDLLLLIAIALVGSTIGFLRYNSYPAKVFMGDSGSLMLGYTLSVLLVALNQPPVKLPVASLTMIVALPLLDTLLVMGRRMMNGHSPFLPDRTHLHHRLLALGVSHPAVVGVIYFVMASFGLLAVVMFHQSEWINFLTLMALGFLVFASVFMLQHRGIHFSAKGRRIHSFRQTQLALDISEHLRQSAKVVGMFVLLALLIPAVFAPLVQLNANKSLSLFLMAMLIAAYSWQLSSANKNILCGSVYLAIWILMLLYEISSVENPSWLEAYNSWSAGLVLLWVVLKLIFSKHNEIVFASGFELLMLFISWFIPFVVMAELPVSPAVLHAVQHACLLSIPFLLAMKINIRVFGGHNRWIAIPLIFGLTVVGFRGLF